MQSNPALLIADEPTSALDVTLEAQITDLIRQLRDELQTSILYITHDLGIVAQICDQVVVLYAGNVVETGDVFSLFKNPLHPYTQALLRSHPSHQTPRRTPDHHPRPGAQSERSSRSAVNLPPAATWPKRFVSPRSPRPSARMAHGRCSAMPTSPIGPENPLQLNAAQAGVRARACR